MKEINFIRPEEVYNRNTGESKVRYTSYDGNNRFIPVVDSENGVPRTLVVTTHAELKAMRDAGKLTPGSLYRITDYQCTTIQENTKSAGHQFDIVLLALSNNKLAEEGWAMMHDNIYDVTFLDGVTKKCYIYEYVDEQDNINYNIVDVETKLGITGVSVLELQINEENKTASTEDWAFAELTDENLPYSYFQNSNLSAWKVWYCLDNDTARFAWASDKSRINIGGEWFDRQETADELNYYAWANENDSSSISYTLSETPKIDDSTYAKYNNQFIEDSPIENVMLEGTGVIYRLIDEWNNDVPYDFKNIMKLKDAYGIEGDYYYLFNASISGGFVNDASLFSRGFAHKNGMQTVPHNNKLYPCFKNFDGEMPTMNSITCIDGIVFSGVIEHEEGGEYAKVATMPINNIIVDTQKTIDNYGNFDTRGNIVTSVKIGILDGFTVGSIN